MKKVKEYDINLVNLSDRKHEYDFELNNRFFEGFEQELVNGGELKAHVVLDKSTLLLNFDIKITGTVNLTCDRSLENFDYPVSISENLLVKFGDQELELDDNVLQIPHDAQTINMAQHLYDYIALAVPMKKLHPRFVTEESEQQEGDILIYSTAATADADEQEEDPNAGDPRWDILKKLHNN